MKKIVILIIAVSLIISLTACGDRESYIEPQRDTTRLSEDTDDSKFEDMNIPSERATTEETESETEKADGEIQSDMIAGTGSKKISGFNKKTNQTIILEMRFMAAR